MLSKASFKIHPLPRMVFGVDSSLNLAATVLGVGRRDALIVTDNGLVAAGIVEPIREQLSSDNINTIVFDGVAANPTDQNVYDGIEKLQELDNPVIVAIGGGSSMDCAKAISIVGANGGGAITDFGIGSRPEKPGFPIIAVPTTAGTGSETNMFSLITVKQLGRKCMVSNPSIQPVTAVLDPKLTLGLPQYPTATCGMDVLTHAIEAFVARGANPYSDGVALETMRMVREYLPRVYKDGSDLEGRSQMLLASTMAAIAFNVAGLGICHGTGHPISAHYNTPHGQTLATMLPHVMRFNTDVCEAKYARVAEALGVADASKSDGDNAQAAIAAVEAMSRDLGLSQNLKSLGGKEEDIDTLVDDALADITTRTNPKRVEAGDAAALYQAAMA